MNDMSVKTFLRIGLVVASVAIAIILSIRLSQGAIDALTGAIVGSIVVGTATGVLGWRQGWDDAMQRSSQPQVNYHIKQTHPAQPQGHQTVMPQHFALPAPQQPQYSTPQPYPNYMPPTHQPQGNGLNWTPVIPPAPSAPVEFADSDSGNDDPVFVS